MPARVMPARVIPVSNTTLKMLASVGLLYFIMMGSTFSSLGVVLPHMIASLGMNFGEAGFGFTLLALAAGIFSMLPSVVIKYCGAWVTLLLGVLAMMLAYAILAVCRTAPVYDLGAVMLGVGFAMIGAVPGLHVLNGWEDKRRSLIFGLYLGCGGIGGLVWPTLVETVIGVVGDWRGYWWFMVAVMGLAGTVSLSVVREKPESGALDAVGEDAAGWSLTDALRTPQFYVVGCAIAATYMVASTVNAFTVSYLTMLGVATATAVVTFSIQSGCHAAFPIMMGSLAGRLPVGMLLAAGLVMQAIGMLALTYGSSFPMLVAFAIGVGGGYGTTFLATTLSLQAYFGRRNYAQIFGSNQLFTTISVIGPVIAGHVADVTGRFDLSFGGCVLLLLAAAIAVATLRPPVKRLAPVAVPAG